MKSTRMFQAIFAGLLVSASAFAQTTEPTPLSEALAKPADTAIALAPTFSAVPAIGKMLGALIVVLILMYVTFMLLKRFSAGRMAGAKGKRSLEVLEATHLAPKKSVALVRVGERAVMVGVTDHQITLLSKLTSEETELLIEKRQNETAQPPFVDLFQAAFKKFTDRSKRQDAVSELPANQSA